MRGIQKITIGLLSGLLIFAGDVQAQRVSTAEIFDRIGRTGVDELARLLSDPEVAIEEKSYAVYRLVDLAWENWDDESTPLSAYYNPILGVLNPQEQEDHHILRMSACVALAGFSRLEGAEGVIAPLGRVLANTDEHEEVRISAARGLGRFVKYPDEASTALITALDAELERGPEADNVEITTAMVRALAYLQDRRSFVPLMKVLRSDFPYRTRSEAQRALLGIRWD